MKKFRCIPIAAGLPIISLGTVVLIALMTWEHWEALHDIELVFTELSLTLLGIVLAVVTAFPAIRRVEIHSNHIKCKGLFPRDTFVIEYSKCIIGMDYHVQNWNKVWWIYLCYGQPPQYKSKNPANRMNAVIIRPGFIKIMYSDAVYETLLEVLPKKQKTALITARRCAGFEKQGKIIF